MVRRFDLEAGRILRQARGTAMSIESDAVKAAKIGYVGNDYCRYHHRDLLSASLE
jgi:hypothetical protein